MSIVVFDHYSGRYKFGTASMCKKEALSYSVKVCLTIKEKDANQCFDHYSVQSDSDQFLGMCFCTNHTNISFNTTWLLLICFLDYFPCFSITFPCLLFPESFFVVHCTCFFLSALKYIFTSPCFVLFSLPCEALFNKRDNRVGNSFDFILPSDKGHKMDFWNYDCWIEREFISFLFGYLWKTQQSK